MTRDGSERRICDLLKTLERIWRQDDKQIRLVLVQYDGFYLL